MVGSAGAMVGSAAGEQATNRAAPRIMVSSRIRIRFDILFSSRKTGKK
jgi:hypothetical protein